MSCKYCVHNNKPSCDPDPNEFGGCASFRADWEPDESDNGGERDIFETLGEAFKPE